MAAEIMNRIIEPTVAAMAAEGCPFKGVLYCGLMLTDDGPKVIEYNARFGDPETQVMLPRMMSDLLPALVATADGVLDKFHLRWRDDAALCVVMATNGYPGAYDKGSVIGGLNGAGALDDITIFHAGTKQDGDNITAAGGRVLGVTATASTIAAAQTRAYGAIDTIDWPEGFCRRDIGWRAVNR